MSTISQFTGKKPRVTVVSGQTGKLVLLVSGNGKSRGCLRISERNVLIGSSPNCTVCLRSPSVKDFQCQIIQGKEQTIIRNLSPETRLNDQSFTEAWLKPGDLISCGQIDINVLEVGSRITESPAAPKNEASGDEFPQPTVSREQLQQLKRQAAELRRKLEEDRQRSDLRAEEHEANLTASRDQLRYTREQLTALLGAQELESQPQPAQAVEPQEQPLAIAQETAVAENKFDWSQNFMAAEACCDGEEFESEEYLESWQVDSLDEQVELLDEQVDSVEESDDTLTDDFVSAVEEEQRSEDLPVELEAFSDDKDSDISGFSEMDESYQVEYVDSFDETECCESIEEFYEATESLADYDDDPSPVDETVQEDLESQADDADQTSTEVEFVAESLKAWFHQTSDTAVLTTNEDFPADRDEANCELPEELKAAIRECESERFNFDVESEREVESQPADEEVLLGDASNEFEPPTEFVLPEPPHSDESDQEELTVLVSEAQEFVASESEVFEAAVSESSDSKESTCEVVKQAEPENSEFKQVGKSQSIISRFLDLFRNKTESSELAIETAEEDLLSEPVAASPESEDLQPVEVEQSKFESPTSEEESQHDEDFDLTADLHEFQIGYESQMMATTPESAVVEASELESTSFIAQPEENDACLDAALLSLSDVPAKLSSDEAFDHEPSMEMEQIEEPPVQDAARAFDTHFTDEPAADESALGESPADEDKEPSALDCDHEEELEAGYEKVLDSMKQSDEKVSVSVAEYSRPTLDAGEEVGGNDQMKDALWHQSVSGPQTSMEFQAESNCEDAGQPVACTSEFPDGITSEVGSPESMEDEVESQDEESIEDYMNRLLLRVGASRQSTKPENRQTPVQPSAIAEQRVEQLSLPQDLLAQTFSQDLESRKRELGPIEISPKSLPALETDHMDQMRLMARESANSAIEASLRRKNATQATTQLGIGCMLLVGGIVQTTLADGLTSASALATVPCYAAALYFFKKYFDWRKSFTSLDAKLAKGARQKPSGAADDKPQIETEFSAESGS